MTATAPYLKELSYPAFERACDLTHLVDGVVNNWTLTTRIKEEPNALEKARAMLRDSGRIVPAGTYRLLLHGGELVMSNTPDEMRDHYPFWAQAKGHVLVTGLGLGMMAAALLRHPHVSEVTVVEVSEDVLQLTGTRLSALAATLHDRRLNLIHADAWTWMPPKGQSYECVWHDIWNSLCTDNLKEMGNLCRRFSRRTKVQDCWGRAFLRYQARRERY